MPMLNTLHHIISSVCQKPFKNLNRYSRFWLRTKVIYHIPWSDEMDGSLIFKGSSTMRMTPSWKILETLRVERPVSKHVSAQGMPVSRGGLCCFGCSNKTWTPLLGTFVTLKIFKNGSEMRKLQHLKVGGSRTEIKQTTKQFPNTPKFFVCCYVAIRVQRWFVELKAVLL
jgi:hypothetical protein